MRVGMIIGICFILFLLPSCSSAELSEQHRNYIEDFEWTVSKAEKKTPYTLTTNEEFLTELKEQGLNVNELMEYPTIFQQIVSLKELCKGEDLSAILYSNGKGELLSAQIQISNASPDVSKLIKKDEYLKSCK
ncbi:hypothetical protein AM500_12645 [Bacillus sp. FJAT-18017]|uniref:hypothetical protein n=1 Tax=Bacillus sp. FJAT-18017 TaxID=1705566 RepID=UPI0006B060CA|nr:hypothetical protein [Bacillus sp. FJAT-18017]ALC90541.1 hypothetical protein AM500_12645 [Bacillus sp. FJAT-18017]